jgi:hypothetical protein
MSDRPFLPARGARRYFSGPAVRALVLWVVLIAMFLAVWQVLRPAEVADPSAYTPPPEGQEPAGSTALRLLPIVFFLVLLVFFSLLALFSRGFNPRNAEGQRALAEGDFERAAAEFEALTKRFRWGPAATVAKFNLALARLSQGRLQEAIDGFSKLEGAATKAVQLGPALACQATIACALRGQLDAARTWLCEAERRVKGSPHEATLAGLIAYGRAVIELREGRHVEVQRWLEERWRELERTLTGATLRPLVVLRAFAVAGAGGEREAGTVAQIKKSLEPIRAGEFAMLEAEWPEMQRFLHT